ncbi:MAG: YdgA family protein [Deltaproteobacteria bacterium]|nr:YdgA family protein [Deltaproteobacteria bacterium]
MRVVLIILLLLIVAVGITPYWFGLETEKTYKKILKEVSESGNVDVAQKSYNRAWFNSTAETVFKIRSRNQKIASLIVNDNISHGPIPLKQLFSANFQLKPVQAIIYSTLKITPETQNELADFFAKLPPAEMKTTLYIRGNGESQLSVPAFNYQLKEKNESINWEGLNGRTTFSSNFKQLTTSMKSLGLMAKNDEFALFVKNIEFNSDLHSDTPDLYSPLGSVTFKIELIDIEKKEAKKERFSIKDIELTGSTEVSNNNINSTHSLGFANLRVDGANYGPGLYEIAIRKIDAPTWGKLQKTLKEIQKVDTPDEKQSLTVFGKIIEILPDLLKKSPEIELTKLSLQTHEGEVLGRAKVIIDGSNPELIKNPFFLLTAVNAEAYISIPAPFFEFMLRNLARKNLITEIEERGDEIPSDQEINELTKSAAARELQRLVEQRIFVVENDNLKLRATYKQGELKLNGQPIELPFVD